MGVVVDVTLRIVPNRPVRKTTTEVTPDDLVWTVEAAAEQAGMCRAAFPSDEQKSLAGPDT